MRGRRYCQDSPIGVHRAYYSARTNPETTTAPCRDCGLVVVKGVDGAWYEPILPTWYVVVIGAILSVVVYATIVP